MTDQPVLRDPCPRCESSPALIPRHLMGEHVATVHPEVLDPADLTGYLAPDPPIGCLGVAAEHPSEPKQPGTDADWPSRRTGLRDQLAAAIHRLRQRT